MITSLEIDAPEVTINRQPAIVTKPPVRGEGWLASTACCKPNLHRDLHIAIDGVRIETAETFDTNANTAAIDLRPDPYAAEDKLFRRDGHAASRADQADRTDPNAAAARIAGSKKRQDAGPLAYRSRAREPLRRRLSSARLNFSVMLRLAATVLGRCEAAWRGGLWARG